MVSWLLRVLLVLVVLRVVWRFLRGIIEGARAPARAGAGGAPGVPLVRDPVCGTYVVQERALSSGTGSETRYFCSERCREAFARGESGRRSA